MYLPDQTINASIVYGDNHVNKGIINLIKLSIHRHRPTKNYILYKAYGM